MSYFTLLLQILNLYVDGVYIDKFTIRKRRIFISDLFQMEAVLKCYQLSLNGLTFDFSENFKLVGTLHQTGISRIFHMGL